MRQGVPALPLLFAFLTCGAIAFGQNVTLSIGSASGAAGGTVTVPISLASSGGAQPEGLQWSFAYSPDILSVAVSAGDSDTFAQKSISCSGTVCIVYGLNNTVIADGTVAVATFQIANNPVDTTIPIQMTGVIGVDATANSLPASGNSGTIILLSQAPPPVITLSGLSCTTTTLNPSGSSSCTVSLSSGAPSGGLTVPLSSNNPNVNIPTGVLVTAGQSSAQFTATALAISSDQNTIVTASAGGTTDNVALNLVAPAQIASLICAPSSLGNNSSTTCTVSLNKAALGTGVIFLGSSVSGVANVLTLPASVTVLANATTATFSAVSGVIPADQSASVTASLNGSSSSATISLITPRLISSLQCALSTLASNANTTCTVAISMPAPAGGVVVVISGAIANVLTLPASITVPANATTATFAATAGALLSNQSATVTGSLNGASINTTVSLAAPVILSSVQCAAPTLASNASTTCTVTLTNAALTGATSVGISGAIANVLTLPASVSVPANATTATFTATAGVILSNQSATVTASLNDVSSNATISLTAPVLLSSVQCAATTLASNTSTTCTVTLTNTAPVGGTSVGISGAITNILLLHPSVTVPANATTATFVATAGAILSNQSATVTASLNGVSSNTTISLAAPVLLSSAQCAATTIASNASAICTVTLTNPAPSGGVSVSLSSNNAIVSVPSSVTVAAGNASVTFSAKAGAVTSSQTAVLTAALNGGSKSFSLSVGPSLPLQLSSLSCATTTLTSNASGTCTVSLNTVAATPTIVSISRGNGSITVPLNVTISTGQSSATFLVTTAVVSSSQVSVAAAWNGQSKSVTLTLTTLQLSTLNCSLTKLTSGGWTSACTATLAAKAPSGGSTVTLSSSNSVITVAPSVVVPAGAASATFAPVVAPQSSSPGTVITATLYGASKTATLSGAASTTQSGSSPVTASIRVSRPIGKPSQQPTTRLLGLYNAGSYLPEQTCSPGSMATLVGSGFTGSEPQRATTSPWPTMLGGLRVTSNGYVDLPISAVTDTLIQFQCPALPAQTPISITVGSKQFAESLQFTMREATPAVYLLDNANQGAVLVDGTNQVAMATTDAMPSRPARKGESLSIYANGLGPIQEDIPLGTPAPLDHAVRAKDQVAVVVGGVELPTSFAGLAPGTTGVYQVSVQLAQDVPSGNAVPFYLKVTLSDGTVVQSNVATMAITTTTTPDISQ